MGPGVAGAARDVVMGQIVPCSLRVKGKFQHLHARQACRVPQGVDLRRQLAQVLGDEADVREPPGKDPQQVHPRPGHPMAAPGGGISIGDGPVPLKAPEVVQPQQVIQPPGTVHPADPPAEAVGLHGVPVVQGIAPQLAVGGEIVRRHPGHLLGHQVFVQLEAAGGRPHVGGVHGHVNGQVADDPA